MSLPAATTPLSGDGRLGVLPVRRSGGGNRHAGSHRAAATGELLEEALELGRADGAFAAAFEPPGPVDPRSERCLGRTPAEFARLLWDGPGDPPSGLELNAPLWYFTGFAEGLDRAARRRRTADRVVVRWVFS